MVLSFFILYTGNRERRTIWIIGEERRDVYNIGRDKSEWKKRFYRRFSCSVQCFAVIIVRKRTKFAEFKITREFRTKLY